MFLVTAIVKPQKLAPLRNALPEVGVVGMTVTEVYGFGRQKGHVCVAPGVEEDYDYLPKVKVELAIEEDLLQICIDAIAATVNTGKIGDGKIFVTKLERAVRVRTGETGHDAVATMREEEFAHA